MVDLLRGPSIPPPLLLTLRGRLQHTPFETLLQAIELAGPARDQGMVIELYKHWIDSQAGTAPLLFAAWVNLGVELNAAGDTDNAILAYQNALVLKPGFFNAAVNLGLLQERRGQAETALAIWGEALQPKAARIGLLNHRGRLLENLKRLEEAEAEFQASLLTDPLQPDVIQHWVRTRQRMCVWPLLDAGITGLSRDYTVRHAGPLSALALFDDIGLQHAIAADWLQRHVPAPPARLAADGYAHDRIRIGYLSSDFCKHAMSFLVAELFERHDRARFEIYGYCSSREDGSDIRRRVIAAFDHYVPIGHLTDAQAAQVIRGHEIDILVDLNGITLGARLETLRWKPAPVQVTYLGFIGPVPLPELDYILCDDYVVPPAAAAAYTPKPLSLPGCFQANDTRAITGAPMSRAEAGVPEDGFVFCCFSDHYKITETMFDAWLAILARTEGTWLWLLDDNPWSCRNLRARAEARGIDPARLLFAGRVEPARYLARFRVPDLFLATFPYNPGTMASDALRMGLPMVTLSGESFVSRMAGSLMRAVGLEEGIATDLPGYVDLAVALATDPARYARFRQALEGDVWRRTIGDIEGFTARLEDTYRRIVKTPAG